MLGEWKSVFVLLVFPAVTFSVLPFHRPNALSELIHPGNLHSVPSNHVTHLSLHPEQPPFPRHPGGMLRLTPRGWVTRGGLHGRGGRWRECANPGHALPSPSRALSAARSRPAPHALRMGGMSPWSCATGPRAPGARHCCQHHPCSPGECWVSRRVRLPPAVGKKNHWNKLGFRVRRCCVSQVICRGKEKAEQSSWKGENEGKWSSVIVEVSSSCEKRGKNTGKSPACGFGDIRKVTLGMDVH